jgi:hypothetical protein
MNARNKEIFIHIEKERGSFFQVRVLDLEHWLLGNQQKQPASFPNPVSLIIATKNLPPSLIFS